MKNIDKKFLKIAVNQAKKSVKLGGFPAGAIVVRDGKILSRGISIGFALHDPTSHAETSSIRKACKKIKSTDLGRATLYASLEPCLMCFQVANWSEVSRIVYGCKKTETMVKKNYYEGNNNINRINVRNNRQIEMKYIPDFEKEMQDLIKEWKNR